MERVGLSHVSGGALEVSVTYEGFDDFWRPFTFGVGPAGQALAGLEAADQEAVRAALRPELPEGPFPLAARCWYATATV